MVVIVSLISLHMARKAVVLDALDWAVATKQGVSQSSSSEAKVCLEHHRRLAGHLGCHLPEITRIIHV